MAKRGAIPIPLDPATVKVIVDTVGAGVAYKHAAQRAGISERTFYTWMSKGRNKLSTEHEAFFAAVKKAESDAIARNVAIIQTVAQAGTWTAAAWWLERRFPDEYGSDRARVRQLEKMLSDLEKLLGNTHVGDAAQADQKGQAKKSKPAPKKSGGG